MLSLHKTVFGIGISVVLATYLVARPSICSIDVAGNYIVTNSANDGNNTLRECVNKIYRDGGTVVFDSDMTIVLSNVITISGGQNNVIIDGGEFDIVVDGNHSTKIFHDNNYGHLALQNLTIQDANSTDNGGAINFGINGTASIENSTITGSISSADGGAIYSESPLSIKNSTISGNSADNSGGGLFTYYTDLNISNSTISENISVSSSGGGLYSFESNINISNSTISKNRAHNDGGGMFCYAGDVNISNSTISKNNARHEGGGIFNGNSAIIELQNSILYGNTAGQDADTNIVNSLGYNIFKIDVTGDELRRTDIVGHDPLLGPLQDNGGDTFTHALMGGSPAIDAGYSTIPLDQRGMPRKGVPDIGAYEYQGGGVNPAIIMYLLN